MNHELLNSLNQLASRLAADERHSAYASVVADAVEELSDPLPCDQQLEKQAQHMSEALLQDGSTAHSARLLADEIEAQGIERVVYGKSHNALRELNRLIVTALREYAHVGIGQRIMDSADAQYFRWLLKHHGGKDAKSCWIGGVEFRGPSIQDAIDQEIAHEESKRG